MKVTILATRISGNDGVSLEAMRWKKILGRMGHKVSLVAGKLDRAGTLLPNLHFQTPEIVKVHDRVVYGNEDYKKVEREIFSQAGEIEGGLREIFHNGYKCDLLIVPNVLSLPVHFPLAVALTRVIEELKLPTIARHHDFWWERQRYLKSSMFPFFERWFPPKLPMMRHVVINSIAQKELKERGFDSTIIPDTFDFKDARTGLDNFNKSFREDFGIDKEDLIFLQATRIVPRKRIELSIELVRKLNNPRIVFVVAGVAGDEAGDYDIKVRNLAKKSGIRCKFIGSRVNSHRRIAFGKKIYTLWDCFVNCDFVTYPTEMEGFGNQFIEAVCFKKPIILTEYNVYKVDIGPLGFKTINMTPEIKKGTIDEVNELIANPNKVKKMVDENFKLGQKNFSFEATKIKIERVINSLA